MAKGRNTSTISFRIADKQYLAIQAKAAKKGLSIGEYSKQLVLKEALREHKRQEVQS